MNIYATFSGAKYDAPTARTVADAPRLGADAVWVYDDVYVARKYPEFVEKMSYFHGHHAARGYGWFTWKPLILLDALRRAAPGDVVMYVDGDSYPIAPLAPLYDLCRRADARFLFTFDASDAGVTDEFISDVRRLTNGRCRIRVGYSRGKVEACNDGLAEEPWTGIVVLASDDMVPAAPHYGRLVRALFADRFPSGDGVLHLNDGRNGRRLNTLCVCDRKYFDRFGALYHGQYASLWCDNEWQEVSERLGRACYVDDVIIRHDWIGDAANGGGDALHRRNESYYERDMRVYQARKAASFPREPVPGVL